jgi:hypothetical protein
MRHGAFIISVLQVGCRALDSLDHHGRWVQIRFYDEPGCFQGNEGELGIYDTGISTRRVASEGYFESLRIEYIEDGCYRMFPNSPYGFQELILVDCSTCFQWFVLPFTPRDCPFPYLLFWHWKNWERGASLPACFKWNGSGNGELIGSVSIFGLFVRRLTQCTRIGCEQNRLI